MWHFKYIIILIYYFRLFGCGRAVTRPCHSMPNYTWKPNNPNHYKPGMLGVFINKTINTITIEVSNRTENSTLSVLVKPFVTNQLSCPYNPNTQSNLRKFFDEFLITVDDDKTNPMKLGNVFTGCYYFILTNQKSESWLWGPVHIVTNKTYHDTMLHCNITEMYPQDRRKPPEMEVSLRITNKCLQLVLHFFELEKNGAAEKEILEQFASKKIAPTQTCSITLENCNGTKGEIVLNCTVSSAFTNITLDQHVPVTCNEDKSWSISVLWKGLKRGNASQYRLDFQQFNQCPNLTYPDLTTWIPLTGLNTFYLQGSPGSDEKPPRMHKEFDINILYAVLTVIVISIFAYWIWKCISSNRHPKKPWQRSTVFIPPPEEGSLYDDDKSKQILLIYAKGSTKLMKAIYAMRDHLKEKCYHQVRDIYSIKEWNEAANLGATGWIENMMKNGSKVIWIDTPEFRSRLSHDKSNTKNQSQSDATDFRDDAIPFAVELAKTSFGNTITQYRRHFVVRIKGFNVPDGAEDPLLVISPYVRYSYPEHLDDLCNHLDK